MLLGCKPGFVFLFALRFAAAVDVCSDTTKASDIVHERDLTAQVYVITGGDSGIGYETAVALASKNATVVLGLRGTTGKYDIALSNIKKRSGNSKVFIVKLDLSSFASVSMFASNVAKQFPKIHTLLCNAGIANNPSSLPNITNDGFERTFQINFLSHFMLMEKLLPVLQQSNGRVVSVASAASFSACPWAGLASNCTDIALLPASATRSSFKGDVPNSPGLHCSNYALSKYLQVFHAAELARRQSAVPVYSLHPGLVKSSMTDKFPNATINSWCHGDLRNCPLGTEEGAATPTYVATASHAELSNADGSYFFHCQPSNSIRSMMAQKHGEAFTLKYQGEIYDMASKWIAGFNQEHPGGMIV